MTVSWRQFTDEGCHRTAAPGHTHMGRLQRGHGLVRSMIHAALPPSVSSRAVQRASSSHDAGRCASALQPKQNAWPLVHVTSFVSCAAGVGDGHHRVR